MEGAIVTGIVVLVIIVFAVFSVVSLRDKDKKNKEENSPVKEIVSKILPPDPPVPADAPKIYIRTKPDELYKEYKMMKSRITIGRINCDIIIDSEVVESKHITIEKCVRDNEMFYLLQNHSRVNPVVYHDQNAKENVILNYKDYVVLSGKDLFYIGGDIKIGTKTKEIIYDEKFDPSTIEGNTQEEKSAARIMWEYRNSIHQNSERAYRTDELNGL